MFACLAPPTIHDQHNDRRTRRLSSNLDSLLNPAAYRNRVESYMDKEFENEERSPENERIEVETKMVDFKSQAPTPEQFAAKHYNPQPMQR